MGGLATTTYCTVLLEAKLFGFEGAAFNPRNLRAGAVNVTTLCTKMMGKWQRLNIENT